MYNHVQPFSADRTQTGQRRQLNEDYLYAGPWPRLGAAMMHLLTLAEGVAGRPRGA